MRGIIKVFTLFIGAILAFLLPYALLLTISAVIAIVFARKVKWKIVILLTLYIFCINAIFGRFVNVDPIIYASRVLFLLILSSVVTFTFSELLEAVAFFRFPKSVYIPVILAYRHFKILERDVKIFQETYKIRFGTLMFKDYFIVYASLIRNILQKIDEVSVAVYLKEKGIEEIVERRRL